jgi:hypothetical protein
MWKHPRMSYPNCPYSEKLSVAEINAQIHKVLDLGVNLNPGAGPVPVRRGITSVRVSTLGPILAALAILSFHCAHNSAQGLGGDHGEPRNIDFPMDPARREVRHAVGEGMQTRGERERERPAHHRMSRKKGGGDLRQIYVLRQGGSGKGGNSTSLISKVHNSFSTLGHGPPVDGIYDWQMSAEAPLG